MPVCFFGWFFFFLSECHERKWLFFCLSCWLSRNENNKNTNHYIKIGARAFASVTREKFNARRGINYNQRWGKRFYFDSLYRQAHVCFAQPGLAPEMLSSAMHCKLKLNSALISLSTGLKSVFIRLISIIWHALLHCYVTFCVVYNV